MVAFARSTEEVQAVVRLCAESRTPLVPFGAGTSLEGHIAATRGGVCLDLSEVRARVRARVRASNQANPDPNPYPNQMNALLHVSAEDMDCSVQAGLTRLSLNEHLRHTGLRFPVDPGADASIGGMAACGASGTSAVRCGTMRENVLGLRAVLASGEVVSTGGRARKSSAGYDLTRLLVGSEGTLAVITEATLRLQAVPAAAAAAVCLFPSLSAAASAVALVLQSGVPVSRCEILDGTTVAAFNAYAADVPDLVEGPTLLFEFEGTEAAVAEQAEISAECCAEHGGGGFEWLGLGLGLGIG